MTRSRKGLLAIPCHVALACAAAIAVSTASRPPLAATYVVPPDDVLIKKADAIVRGRVTSVHPLLEPEGSIHTDVTVRIESALKGDPGPTVTFEQLGGVVGDRMDVYPGTGDFSVGEEVLVMLSRHPGGRVRVTDYALGKFHVGRSADGSEFLRRDGLADAFVFNPSGESANRFTDGVFEQDRDSVKFQRYVRSIVSGRPAPADYSLPAPAVETKETSRVAGFTFLGSPPARWLEFDFGQPVNYKDNSTGDSGTNCQPDGCHTETAAAADRWNAAPGAIINLVYSGQDSSIGTKCLNQLSDEVQYNDPCHDMKDLVSCGGTLALGGFSAFSSGGGSPSCPSMGNPSFGRITEGRTSVNNGVGSCLSRCDYEEMITHETGHRLGAGHSSDPSALMNAFLHTPSQCGLLRADDIAYAQCSYPQSNLTCDLSAKPSWAGPPPINVAFDSGARGGLQPYTFAYDFGDTGSSTQTAPVHAYATAATFTAHVTVTDSNNDTCNSDVDVTIQPCSPPIITSVTPKLVNGILKAVVIGRNFHRHDVVQLKTADVFVSAPKTVFKTSKKLVANNVATLWPGTTVIVQVLGATGCLSNPVQATK